MKSNRKPGEKAWFRKTRGSYLPCSWQGWLLYIPMIAFLINVFLVIDRGSHSASDTLYAFFPYAVCTVVVMHWLAARKS